MPYRLAIPQNSDSIITYCFKKCKHFFQTHVLQETGRRIRCTCRLCLFRFALNICHRVNEYSVPVYLKMQMGGIGAFDFRRIAYGADCVASFDLVSGGDGDAAV